MQRLQFALLASLLLLVLLLPGIRSTPIDQDVDIVHYQPEQVHLSFGGECDLLYFSHYVNCSPAALH